MKLVKTSLSFAAGAVLAAAVGLSAQPATAASIQGVKPDVEASVWQEDGVEVAVVTLNGKEIITFRDENGEGSAGEKAETMACRLQELLDDSKLDVNEILPGKNADIATIQYEGSTVLAFEPGVEREEGRDPSAACLERSLKVVNAIRRAFEVPLLPSSFLKLADHDEVKCSRTAFSGHASWYGGRFHGRKTSDGSRYDQEKLTAAHRTLPFGTKLLVMNRKTGDSCVVEINDRGPFVGDRVIDLSRAAARQLNMISAGVALVDCLILGSN